MISTYFAEIEKTLQAFTNIRTYTLQTKIYNGTQGYINGNVVFENNYRLNFVEVKDTNVTAKSKYGYHYMDESQTLVFRYDNAPHYPQIRTFPHHKHLPGTVRACEEPTLNNILLEIAEIERTVAPNKPL